MDKTHHYSLSVEWTGNKGVGTKGYRSYERNHTISINSKVDIAGSSDAAFRGDKNKHSPEDLFVASIAACHMLWYLHLCAEAEVVVTEYIDHATGLMTETSNGGGRFTSITLSPTITVTNQSMIATAEKLHHKANELCFLAQSCNFPIHHRPIVLVKGN